MKFFCKTAFKMSQIVFLTFLTLILSVILTSAGPLSKKQIYRYKNNNGNAHNKNRIEKDHRKINNNNNNNILKRKRLEAKKARLELIDEMLKFYWDTLEVFNFILPPCITFFILAIFAHNFLSSGAEGHP